MAILNAYKGIEPVSSEIRDRSPHSSPKRESQLVVDDVVSSDSDGDKIVLPDPVSLEFFAESCSLSEDSCLSIQPPRQPTHFFPLIADTPVKNTQSM